MKGTTPKKGRPTPTAPQNRKDRVDLNLRRNDTEHRPRSERMPTGYHAYREATRFWRRAFGGLTPLGLRTVVDHQSDAQAQFKRDGSDVRRYINDQLGGVEDIVKISQGLGMKRGRVRLILSKGLAS